MVLFLSAHHGRKSHEDKSQKKNSQNQINQKSIGHPIHLLNQILKIQKPTVVSSPNTTSIRLNLSRTAGNTTEARVTKPMSDAISASFSNCLSLNFGKSRVLKTIATP
jgi:hypothetical protein